MKTSCIPCPTGTFTVGKGAKSRGECGSKSFMLPACVRSWLQVRSISVELSIQGVAINKPTIVLFVCSN